MKNLKKQLRTGRIMSERTNKLLRKEVRNRLLDEITNNIFNSIILPTYAGICDGVNNEFWDNNRMSI